MFSFTKVSDKEVKIEKPSCKLLGTITMGDEDYTLTEDCQTGEIVPR